MVTQLFWNYNEDKTLVQNNTEKFFYFYVNEEYVNVKYIVQDKCLMNAHMLKIKDIRYVYYIL